MNGNKINNPVKCCNKMESPVNTMQTKSKLETLFARFINPDSHSPAYVLCMTYKTFSTWFKRAYSWVNTEGESHLRLYAVCTGE